MAECCIILPDLQYQDYRALLRALDAFRQVRVEKNSLLRGTANTKYTHRQYAENAKITYLEPRRSRFQRASIDRQDSLMKHLAYDQTLKAIDDAVLSNSQIAVGIYQAGCAELTKVVREISAPETWHGTATDSDCSIARACIRGLFRDWSREGAPERNAAHVPILNVLRKEFDSCKEKGSIRVIVPGVGLGRLLHSISELGFSVEGNDVSCHTLLTCMYLFGDKNRGISQMLYPWVLSFSNHISRQHQLHSVMIPDLYPTSTIKFVSPCAVNTATQIILTKGGFVDVYGISTQANAFSAITTCFFIDTAPNFLDYVSTAWNCLKAGGIWVNIGPLLWNIEENGPAGKEEGDIDGQESWKARTERPNFAGATLELTAEEVLQILKLRGFAIEQVSSNVGASTYVGNKSSMLQYTYNMVFWVARKPEQTA